MVKPAGKQNKTNNSINCPNNNNVVIMADTAKSWPTFPMRPAWISHHVLKIYAIKKISIIRKKLKQRKETAEGHRLGLCVNTVRTPNVSPHHTPAAR